MSRARRVIGLIFTALCGLVVWVYDQQGAQPRRALRVVNRTYCYMITGRRPDRADAAQRLSEKTLQKSAFLQSGRDRLFRGPGM